MAVARKRFARKVETLHERWLDYRLPCEPELERCAIGAVLLAPNGHAKRLSRRAYSGHFYDRARGWLWEELGLALVRCRLELDNAEQIGAWMTTVNLGGRFRDKWHSCCYVELAACIRDAFWWHGDWYVDRVLAAAKVRSRIVTAADHLREALTAGDEWRAGR